MPFCFKAPRTLGWRNIAVAVMSGPLLCSESAVAFRSELNDSAAIALRWPGCGCGIEVHHCLALGCHLDTRLVALLGFLIERLGNPRWPADVAEQKYFDLEVRSFGPYLQEIANANLARGLCRLLVALYSAQLARACSQAACLEESRSPKPFVEPYVGHATILNWW
jgi:hypothetical protein